MRGLLPDGGGSFSLTNGVFLTLEDGVILKTRPKKYNILKAKELCPMLHFQVSL